MMDVSLSITEEDAKALYRHLHRIPGGQETFFDVYQQLQKHFYQTLTIEELTDLLEGLE